MIEIGSYQKGKLPDGWEIIPHLHNGYKYKGYKVMRIDRQQGMVELVARVNGKRVAVMELGVFQAMKEIEKKIKRLG